MIVQRVEQDSAGLNWHERLTQKFFWGVRGNTEN